MTEQQQPRVQWGTDGFASVSGWAFVHCANETGEYFLSQDTWVVVGTGLPASAYLDAPPAPQTGMAIIRQNGAWSLVDDLRGQTAFDKYTRQAVIVSQLGPLPAELTLVRPVSQFDVWDETLGVWVTDESAELDHLTEQAVQLRALKMSEASVEIAALLDALDPNVISDPDDKAQALLLQWKRYRAELAVIDCTNHPVNWPTVPTV